MDAGQQQMYSQFPLERLCSYTEAGFQRMFPLSALDILSDPPDCKFLVTGEGLLVLAETEDAMRHPLGILRAAYGEQLWLGQLTVRYRQGSVLEEPHMGMRLSCPVRYCDAVWGNVQARGAKVISTEVERSFAVMRATAPLVAVLGYSDFLTNLTHGAARVVMWLSHYAPVASAEAPSARLAYLEK